MLFTTQVKHLLSCSFVVHHHVVLGICFDLVYCSAPLLCIFVMVLSSHGVVLFFASAQWCSFHDLLICIAFISSYYSNFQLIMLFYCALPWPYVNGFWFGFIAMSFCCAFLWWSHVSSSLGVSLFYKCTMVFTS